MFDLRSVGNLFSRVCLCYQFILSFNLFLPLLTLLSLVHCNRSSTGVHRCFSLQYSRASDIQVPVVPVKEQTSRRKIEDPEIRTDLKNDNDLHDLTKVN